MGLHTAVFLDIDMNKGYMTVNQGIELLLKIDEKRGQNLIKGSIAVGIANAGSEKPIVRADFAENLESCDFGSPLHIVVIPADLHFVEAESLIKLADAPESILEEGDIN
jgi:diphthine synthase